MAQTRNTIELLTKILEENGTSKIKAEIFRLAKFNDKDAVAPMWKLLFELVYYCEFGKIDHVSVKAFGELSTEELVIFVKRQLQTRGFYSKEFAMLPADMSSGSREVLLALGWLLCKENIIARFIKNCTAPIGDDTVMLHMDGVAAAAVKEKSEDNTTKGDLYTKVQQLLLLNNKLRLSLRNLYALQRENMLLKHKIHKSTYGTVSASGERNHLSEMEVYMLRHPQLLKNNLDLLEQDSLRLQHLLAWQEHEDHFWKWMGSVLDAKLQSKNTNTADDAPSAIRMDHSMASPENSNTAASSEPGSSDGVMWMKDAGDGDGVSNTPDHLSKAELYARLQQSHLTIHEAVTKYEAVVSHLEHIWEEKSSEITDEDLDSVLSSIDQELSVQRANVMLRNCQSYMENGSTEGSTSLSNYPATDMDTERRDPRLIYDGKAQHRQFGSHPRVEQRLHASRAVEEDNRNVKHIEEEIQSLNDLVERLQQEVNEKQSHFKHEMQILSAKFQDAICIPPMQPN